MILLSSCSYKFIPLRGTYPKSSIVIDKSFNDVWNNVIDFVSENGYSFTYLDKENGLIVFKSSLIYSFTFEDNDGKPINPDAYFVLPIFTSEQGYDKRVISSINIICNWNIRVRALNDKTKVSINFYDSDITYLKTSYPNIRFASTGKFEKEAFEKIK